MANLTRLMWQNAFDEIINQQILWSLLDGNVRVCQDMLSDKILVGFFFREKYLIINDILNYEITEFYSEKVIEDILKCLKEIKRQFYCYFNAIWC